MRDFPDLFLSVCFQDFYPPTVLSTVLIHGREGLDESCMNSQNLLYLVSLVCNFSEIVA